MSARYAPHQAVVAVLAASMLLGGCVTPGPATRFYLLTPAAETPLPVPEKSLDRKEKPVTVLIKDLRLPLYLDRPQIVTRDLGNRLEFSEMEQWGGHLREDMARVLAINLGQALEGAGVVAAPAASPVPPDYRVEVDILAFERQPGGRVVLYAYWAITRGRDGKPQAGSEGKFSGEPLADSVTYDKLVGSMSTVYGELAQAIARDIRRREVGGL